jgi:hypothetical protein
LKNNAETLHFHTFLPQLYPNFTPTLPQLYPTLPQLYPTLPRLYHIYPNFTQTLPQLYSSLPPLGWGVHIFASSTWNF